MDCPNCNSSNLVRGNQNLWCRNCGYFPIYEDVYLCCNADCGWTGERADCVYPTHSDPDDDANLRCPECYEVVERASE